MDTETTSITCCRFDTDILHHSQQGKRNRVYEREIKGSALIICNKPGFWRWCKM